jgi:hypothetical protein
MMTMIFVILTTACATRVTQTRSSAPAGPIQTNTIEPGVIPAGTTLALRANESITSDQLNRTYAAQVEQDIMDQYGRLLVPKGSSAQLAILQTSGGGTVGTRTMELGIRSVTVRGTTYPIATAGLEQRGEEGLGSNRRTAEMVGGGAVLGTLIGAAVGGGKGAAVGAVLGAAGGATAQVLTRGENISVPAETLLTFRLDQPWRLEGYS